MNFTAPALAERALVALLIAFVIAACGSSPSGGTTGDAGSKAPVPAGNQDAVPARANHQVLSTTAPIGLPAYAFDTVPGWLAFATAVRKDGEAFRYPWSPPSNGYQVVLFADDESPWKAVPAGRQFVAVGRAGAAAMQLSGFGRRPYGCDGNTAPMVSFTGPMLQEEPVWLLPNGTTGVEAVGIRAGTSADVLPILMAAGPASTALRVFVAGPVTLLQLPTGKTTVRTSVMVGGRTVLDMNSTKHYMEGAPQDPVDLKVEGEFGIPHPVGAFSFGPSSPFVVVLWTRGYEGSSFSVLRIDAAGARILEGPYLYYCAF